jgi:hypothetical protein
MTPSLKTLRKGVWGRIWDFGNLFVYFSFHQHGFDKEERGLPVQHILMPGAVVFSARAFTQALFEMLNDVVVGLCDDTKEYAQKKFGNPVDAHDTPQEESPTLDKNYPEMKWYSLRRDDLFSRYIPSRYIFSSSIIEAVAGCYDTSLERLFHRGGTEHGDTATATATTSTRLRRVSRRALRRQGLCRGLGFARAHNRALKYNGPRYGNGTSAGLQGSFVQNFRLPADVWRFTRWMIYTRNA